MWSVELAVYLLGMIGIMCVASIWIGLVLERKKKVVKEE